MSKPHRYAEKTKVPMSRSREEIERLVIKHGATGLVSGFDKDRYFIMFEIQNRRMRFDIPAPKPSEFDTVNQFESEQRRRWRALLLILKAKLELVASGDADLEAEFLAYMVLPDGQTMGAKLLPQLEQIIKGGKLPPLLPPA